jgi:hypothetical protein
MKCCMDAALAGISKWDGALKLAQEGPHQDNPERQLILGVSN